MAHEGLGTIGTLLELNGFTPEFVRIYRGEKAPRTIEGYMALISLGGPMGVYEDAVFPFIKDEISLMEKALRDGLPMLGICLGSQLLAKAAGARVYKGGTKEIGWYGLKLTDEGAGDKIFLGMPKEMTVFQWHGDTFDVPEGAVNLASSDAFPNQLIKVGSNAYGIQFHLEVTQEMVRDWITVNSAELKALEGAVDPAKTLIDTPEKIGELNRYGRAVISKFLRIVDR